MGIVTWSTDEANTRGHDASQRVKMGAVSLTRTTLTAAHYLSSTNRIIMIIMQVVSISHTQDWFLRSFSWMLSNQAV